MPRGLRRAKIGFPLDGCTITPNHVLGHRDCQNHCKIKVFAPRRAWALSGADRVTDLPNDVFWNPVALHCRSQSSIIHVSSWSGGSLDHSLQITNSRNSRMLAILATYCTTSGLLFERMPLRTARKNMLLLTLPVATARKTPFHGRSRLPILKLMPVNVKLRPPLPQASTQVMGSRAARRLSRSVWDNT